MCTFNTNGLLILHSLPIAHETEAVYTFTEAYKPIVFRIRVSI